MTWWITDTSIGQRLKFVRRFRRLTQKELGLLMGYSEKTADVRIAQYEKNARTPNAETTAKLAEVLKVSPVVFSPTICASREDLLQSMYWLFLIGGGGHDSICFLKSFFVFLPCLMCVIRFFQFFVLFNKSFQCICVSAFCQCCMCIF